MGRTYLVTAVRTTWPMRPIAKPRPGVRWVPVMGPRHSDNDAVNFPPQHWHADPRFLDHGELWGDPSVRQHFRYFEASEFDLEFAYFRIPIVEATPEPATGENPDDTIWVSDLINSPVPQESYIRLLPFQLRHEVPGYPGTQDYLPELTEQFRDQALIEDRFCPHRGADLAGITPDPQGIITCPLHGLRWCARTGRVQDPLPPPEDPDEDL